MPGSVLRLRICMCLIDRSDANYYAMTCAYYGFPHGRVMPATFHPQHDGVYRDYQSSSAQGSAQRLHQSSARAALEHLRASHQYCPVQNGRRSLRGREQVECTSPSTAANTPEPVPSSLFCQLLLRCLVFLRGARTPSAAWILQSKAPSGP